MEARCFGFRGKHGAPAGAAAAGVFGCAEAADVMEIDRAGCQEFRAIWLKDIIAQDIRDIYLRSQRTSP
jgi:hypothetical protein